VLQDVRSPAERHRKGRRKQRDKKKKGLSVVGGKTNGGLHRGATFKV
jgi:hypothetical protein